MPPDHRPSARAGCSKISPAVPFSLSPTHFSRNGHVGGNVKQQIKHIVSVTGKCYIKQKRVSHERGLDKTKVLFFGTSVIIKRQESVLN